MKIRKILVFMALAFFMQGAFAQTNAPASITQDKDEKVKPAFRSDMLEQIETIQDYGEIAKLKYQLRLESESSSKFQKPGKEKEVVNEEFNAGPLSKFEVGIKRDELTREKAEENTPFYRSEEYEKAMKKAQAYECGKMLDTMVDYNFTDGQWVMNYRYIYTYDDNGNMTVSLNQDYNTTDYEDPVWINDSKVEFTYDNNGNITEEAHIYWDDTEEAWVNGWRWKNTYNSDGNITEELNQDWDATNEEWVNNRRYVFTYDANGMTSQTNEYWDSTNDEWDFNYRDAYEFNAEGYMTMYAADVKADDGTYYHEDYWKIDPETWPADWTFDYGDFYWDYVNGGISFKYTEEYYRTGFDPAAGEFSDGEYYKYTYVDEVDEYYYDESIEYGDIFTDVTYLAWDNANQEWVSSQKWVNIEYNPYGMFKTYIEQKYDGSEFKDSLKYSWTYENAVMDCYGDFDYQYPKTEKTELMTSGGWEIIEHIIYNDYSWGETLVEISKTWDFDNGEFVNGTYIQNSWDYGINYYYPYKKEVQVWDIATQDWVDNYYYETKNNPVYMGNGSFGTADIYAAPGNAKHSYFVQKVYDTTNAEWTYYQLDSTEYNDAGYPVERTEKGFQLAEEERETLTYDGEGLVNVYTYYGSYDAGADAWVESYREDFSYDSDDQVTVYLEQYHDGTEWVNDFRTQYSYDATTSDYLVDSTFMYRTTDQSWDGTNEEWVNVDRVYWGDDWDIWMYYDGAESEWIYDQWWYDQDFTWAAYVTEDYGVKLWDTTTTRWWYAEQYWADWSLNCTSSWFNLTFEQYASGSNDGRSLVNQFKNEASFHCPGNDKTMDYQYEWDATNDDWKLVYKYDKVYEAVDECTEQVASEEGYEWDDDNNIWIRVDGFEEYEEYDDDLLIESWTKNWNNGNLSGWRNLYTYSNDGYELTSVYQNIGPNGEWQNSDKDMNIWSGVAGIEIVDGEITNVACYGDSTGGVEIVVEGGTLPYSFSWSNGDTTQNLTNVPAGVYTGTITDANGCQLTSPKVEITQPQDPITIFVDSEAATDKYTPDGKAWVDSVYGGTPPYTYQWNDPIRTVGDTASGLRGEEFTVLVTDDLGCTNTKAVEVEPIVVVGLDNPFADNAIDVYPNPASQIVNVTVKDKFVGSELTVYSTSGAVLHKENLTSTDTKLDLSGYEAGLYIVTVKAQDKVYNQKLLVK